MDIDIKSPIPTALVDEYDFTFSNGLMMEISLDFSRGDTIDFSDPHIITAHKVPTESTLNPGKTIPAENLTIFKSQIMVMQHRQREEQQKTAEQKDEWKELINSFTSKTVQ